MSLTIANTYLLQALDYYPYDLERVAEALGYALGYDEEHAGIHCLYGRIYAEQLHQYDQAKHHYELAIMYDANYIESYDHYIRLLLRLNMLDRAAELIQKAIKISGVSEIMMNYYSAIIYEKKGAVAEALELMQITRQACCTHTEVEFIQNEIKRIRSKEKSKNGATKESTEAKTRTFRKRWQAAIRAFWTL